MKRFLFFIAFIISLNGSVSAKKTINTPVILNTTKQSEYEKCLQEQAILQSQIIREQNSCDIKYSEYRLCFGRVNERASRNTGKGALLGLGAAFFTGGASLIVGTVGGAIVGNTVTNSVREECGIQPNCEYSIIKKQVQTELNIKQVSCK